MLAIRLRPDLKDYYLAAESARNPDLVYGSEEAKRELGL